MVDYINFSEILNLSITPEDCIAWATNVIKMKYDCILPPKISIKIENDGFFNTMPAYIPVLHRFGVKVVSRITSRKPALQADLLLYSDNGDLLAFMDGTWITTMRTGAIAAITAEKLKKTSTKYYSFIGLGNTARATLLCLNAIKNKNELNINLLAYKNQHEQFIERFLEFKNIHFTVYTSIDELVKSSDVIFSCVTVANDIFSAEENYAPGVLVIPIHTRGFQNCDLKFDKIFCDDMDHISGFKYFKQYKCKEEFSNVILGKAKGRENDNERILAYNIGIGIQDVFFASKIYERIIVSNKELINQNSFIQNEKYWV
jgi:ornithine cyclodeaminase/alanine dehydrogenase-like protein (mu-crystallin family)